MGKAAHAGHPLATQLPSVHALTPHLQAVGPGISGGWRGDVDTRLPFSRQFAQAFAIGLLIISRVLIPTRACALGQSVRETDRLPHGGVVVPWGVAF